MSESLGMSLEIGGSIPKILLPELIKKIHGDFDNLMGPELEDLLVMKENPKWDGTGNYGLCNDVTSFLNEHDIPYIHKSDASSECDPEITYWVPGMKETETIKGNNDLDPTVRTERIKPLGNLLIDLFEIGEAALPLHINSTSSIVRKLVNKNLKRFSKKILIKDLKKALNEMLPCIPTLPPFTITE